VALLSSGWREGGGEKKEDWEAMDLCLLRRRVGGGKGGRLTLFHVGLEKGEGGKKGGRGGLLQYAHSLGEGGGKEERHV